MENEDVIHACCVRLGEKAHLLDRFVQATAKVKDGIGSREAEAIARNLRKRQAIIDRIESIDRELASLRIAHGFSLEKANESIRSHVKQIRVSLETLSSMDRECLGLAQAEYDSLRSAILGIKSGLRVAKCYGRTRTQTPRFLDLKR